MNKFIVIKGGVVGGHTIQDLGITVPYQETITIEASRAAWSRDLNHALQQKLVEKVRVITGSEAAAPTPRPHRVKTDVRARPKHTTKLPSSSDLPDIPSSSSEGLQEASFAKSEAMIEKSLEENEKLRQMNSELMKTVNQLMKQQETLVHKLSDYMDRPVQIVGTGSQAVSQSSAVEDDTPAFIPSKIRTGKAKANKEVGVSSDSSGGGNFDDAAAALAAMRKGKKK